MSSNTGDQPRRKFPPEVARYLRPNSEYTRWGDFLFEVYGSHPDGTLAKGDVLTPEQERRLDGLYERKYKDVEFPARLTPPLKSKWPLTHAERIAELEEILEKDLPTLDYKDDKNIKAAIEYHKGFKDQNELCEPTLLQFSDGKIDMEDSDDPHAWYEINIEFRVDSNTGGTGNRIRTTAFHDTGSELLTVFESELDFLLRDGANSRFIRTGLVITPTGSTQSRQFTVEIRLLTADNSRVLRDWHSAPANIVHRRYRLASRVTLMRRQFFLASHPRNHGLYVTKTKAALGDMLPN
ncbi:hypothetical protein FQN50_006279 [Emmonsiellopsis sp. PD_5]|nr:hypothetical protein FQN50_006279 [Emmonsiellopsis sp. PD_5]